MFQLENLEKMPFLSMKISVINLDLILLACNIAKSHIILAQIFGETNADFKYIRYVF
jgi:hypothetical protein